MEKTYDPIHIESSCYAQWEAAGYFKPTGKGLAYTMVIPPPNVTGTLHMGHGFQYTLMDTLVRYHRMCGDRTLWQPGVDHAGIATQMVVERNLTQEGTSRLKIGREAFLERAMAWKEESGDCIVNQSKRLGTSPDWSRARFTMDSAMCQVVNDVFIQLYDEGIIYRGNRLVNWDPKFHSAISDLEVVTEEEKGSLWYFRYPLSDGSASLTIATTRPETLLGDTAVAVHPTDERYQSLIGKTIRLPLVNREIPIIADDYVDASFGSGCVKITPAHDFNDYEIAKRHNLPMINILTFDAKMNEQTPQAYRGIDRFDARKIIADMAALGLLEKVEDYTIKIPRGDRSGVIVEPMLTDQWYVRTADLAGPAIEAVEKGDIQFVPEHWDKTYFQWMHHIEDWCISRQLWWGHRIPAWYDEAGHVYVATSEEKVREKYQLSPTLILKQDEDVLDTWFSAALWPFATLGWPNDSQTFETFFPTNVLITGFDIIFFWVARMIMMSLKLTGKVPFKEVYITGLIRDPNGQKMSKSKGNIIDPIDLIDGISLEALIEKRCYGLMQPQMAQKIKQETKKQFPHGIEAHGTDAVRFTFCALSNNNRNIRFDLNRLTGYRNFCNKLWNASRYVLMNVQDQDIGETGNPIEFSLPDRWILSRLQATIEKVHQVFSQYRFDFLSQTLYEFIWHEYCDWYLELSKVLLNEEEATLAIKRGARHTLITVLESILRLAHPLIPFITETIWQSVKPVISATGKSLMMQSYPVVNPAQTDEEAEKAIAWLKEIVLAIRNIRGEMNLPPNKALTVYFANYSDDDLAYLEETQGLLHPLARLENLECQPSKALLPACATAVVHNLEIYIPLAGLIDVEAERERLKKESEKVEKEMTRLHHKLGNPSFAAHAPAEIVEKEREKLIVYEETFSKLKTQREKLSVL